MHEENNAKIEWRDGQPYATTFQDVYFSSDNGMLETEHVFLQGNALAERWQQLNTNTFTIAETGFGSGLNFLCTTKTWLATAPEHAILRFISVEKYPLGLADITQALQLWPELNNLTTPLLEQYQQLLNGLQSIMLFNHRVELCLFIGDVSTGLKAIKQTYTNPQIDAWFLDGFSPAKNPDMWQPALFEHMARLSSSQTTFATFTSAGAVRRGLAAAGFKVNKRAGFGKKREMLYGTYTGTTNGS